MPITLYKLFCSFDWSNGKRANFKSDWVGLKHAPSSYSADGMLTLTSHRIYPLPIPDYNAAQRRHTLFASGSLGLFVCLGDRLCLSTSSLFFPDVYVFVSQYITGRGTIILWKNKITIILVRTWRYKFVVISVLQSACQQLFISELHQLATQGGPVCR